MNTVFLNRVKEYFGDKSDEYLEKLKESPTHGFFLNTSKASKESILDILDFKYIESKYNHNSYFHNEESIGKTKAFELGLIYPQDAESSYFAELLNIDEPKLIVDLCAAPGGKTINILNRFNNAYCISNDVNHSRALELSKNLERLGLTNATITNKDPKDLLKVLKGNVDLVILDAPCSGEGMIRKYREILDEYSVSNINNLASIQKQLLNIAYDLIKKDGHIVYSTCTYAFEEDENQVRDFLIRHADTSLVNLKSINNYSKLEGTVKLCPLNGTEGQFISLIKRNSENENTKIKSLNETDNKLVKEFIDKNLIINDYHLYKKENSYYISFIPLIDLGNNVIRNGIYIGDVIKNRFEPAHTMYRSIELINKFKNVIDLTSNEYETYIQGLEIKTNNLDGYYLVTYKNKSLGFGKVSNNTLKNKYPKGLRKK